MLFISLCSAQTILSVGDIAIIHMDTNDEVFAFVTFIDLEPGTQIFFTDEEADGDLTFGTGEGTILFTAPAGGIIGGTVITANTDGSATNFSATSDGAMALANSGDGIFAYQGTLSNPTDASSILHFVGEDAGDLGTLPPGALPGGAGTDYLLIGNDNFDYDGVRNGEPADLFTSINTIANSDVSGNAIDLNATDFNLIVLPVELASITAELVGVENQTTRLTWTTNTETDNDYFEIQHSTNGLDWALIGMVDGNGTSQQAHNYSFTHYETLLGTNYYRLKQVDFDLSYEYSNIVSVNTNQIDNLKITRVDRNSINLSSNLQGIASYSLYNSQGRLIKQGSFDSIIGNQAIYFNNGEIISGFYFVEIILEQQRIIEKFIVN